MRPAIDEGYLAYQAAGDRTKALQAYIGAEAHNHMVGLLSALADCYRAELVDVTPDQLVKVQTALRQVLALRDSITTEGASAPRI